jgi:demethylmenaquinone methyltransferase/2-methoxy-6-polyprenyl-1,4-benzoquinol methylase
MIGAYSTNLHARRLFDGIARSYEGPAELFSFFQYGRWRRFLVSQLRLPAHASVLDVCTGTGLVARDIARRSASRVLGIDLASGMIDEAQRKLEVGALPRSISLVKARAESLPFLDSSFDAVVFTFLLRYVLDAEATLNQLARVLRPGGQMLSLDFFVPQNWLMYPFWHLHTHFLLRLGTRLLSPQWQQVGSFLGPSISAFYRAHSLRSLEEMWARVGIGNVQTKPLSFGGALAMWGRKQLDGKH